MNNAWDEINNALRDARAVDAALRSHCNAMATLLVGRLRHLHPVQLEAFKRELRDYNIHTGEWKP